MMKWIYATVWLVLIYVSAYLVYLEGFEVRVATVFLWTALAVVGWVAGAHIGRNDEL